MLLPHARSGQCLASWGCVRGDVDLRQMLLRCCYLMGPFVRKQRGELRLSIG